MSGPAPATAANPVIEVRDLRTHLVTRWGTVRAVDGVSFALAADREHRVQRRHRLLEDHRDLAAAHAAHLFFAEREQVAALVENFS